jgi:hypothetical protein
LWWQLSGGTQGSSCLYTAIDSSEEADRLDTDQNWWEVLYALCGKFNCLSLAIPVPNSVPVHGDGRWVLMLLTQMNLAPFAIEPSPVETNTARLLLSRFRNLPPKRGALLVTLGATGLN